MKKLAVAFCVVAVAAVSSVSAADYRAPLFPAPATFGFQDAPPAPEGEAPKPVAEAVEAITLYDCVKYEDLDHIAPCAEVKIVKVLDPCWRPDPCACCQKPKYVYVKICVPKKVVCCKPAPPSCCAPAPKPCCSKCHACGCDHKREKVTCRDKGAYTKYDYGKYRVEIRVKKNGWVVVDYDD